MDNYDYYNDEIIENFLADLVILFWKRFSLYNKIQNMKFLYFNAAISDCFNHLLTENKYNTLESNLSN